MHVEWRFTERHIFAEEKLSVFRLDSEAFQVQFLFLIERDPSGLEANVLRDGKVFELDRKHILAERAVRDVDGKLRYLNVHVYDFCFLLEIEDALDGVLPHGASPLEAFELFLQWIFIGVTIYEGVHKLLE